LFAVVQVFIVDMSKYKDLVQPSKDSVQELPIGVFFIDGPSAKEGKLMPLAIIFTVNNQNVYSPKDDKLDW